MTDRDRDPQENIEQIVNLARGQKGDRGERGERGLPRAQRRAIIWMFGLSMLFVGLCFLAVFHYVRANEQQQCGNIAQVVAIPVPTPTAGNPSRAWEAQDEGIQRHRGVQLGCRLPRPRTTPAVPASPTGRTS